MATWSTQGVSIRRIAAATPAHSERVEEASGRFGLEEVRRLASSTGVWSRRVAPARVCTSDLAMAAAESAIGDIGWARSSIDAVIFVSQTPDYRLPATACCMQARLGLDTRCLAFDVSLGCSGYVYGLFLAAQLARSGAAGRVLLAVGDTITKLVDPNDRATALLFGDAASATLVEADAASPGMSFVLGTDGTGARHLIVPAGASRDARVRPNGAAHAGPTDGAADPACLQMNGAEVFAFTLREVPAMVTRVAATAEWSLDSVDLVVFHQANAMILGRLTKKLGLPPAKVPIVLNDLGNTSSASVPVALCRSVGDAPRALDRVILAGFGVGLSWGAAAVGLKAGAVMPLLEVEGAEVV